MMLDYLSPYFIEKSEIVITDMYINLDYIYFDHWGVMLFY